MNGGTFTLTAAAARDIEEILGYVLEHSGATRARHVYDKLLDGCRKIGAYPDLAGHCRDDLADESVRVFVVFSYLIIYRPTTMPVQILRVVHGARDLSVVFRGED
ncbi:MAG: type II toxin-antitoxin system RelE/ParE family toxin [Planctomycetota bacterium]